MRLPRDRSAKWQKYLFCGQHFDWFRNVRFVDANKSKHFEWNLSFSRQRNFPSFSWKTIIFRFFLFLTNFHLKLFVDKNNVSLWVFDISVISAAGRKDLCWTRLKFDIFMWIVNLVLLCVYFFFFLSISVVVFFRLIDSHRIHFVGRKSSNRKHKSLRWMPFLFTFVSLFWSGRNERCFVACQLLRF